MKTKEVIRKTPLLLSTPSLFGVTNRPNTMPLIPFSQDRSVSAFREGTLLLGYHN